MSPKAKATSEPIEATPETPVGEMTLEQALAKIAEYEKEKAESDKASAEKDKKIATLEKKEEGWLIWTDNPQYDGITADVQFTNGQAWLPVDRVLSRYLVTMPTESQMHKMANDEHEIDKTTTFEEVKARFEAATKLSSVERCVRILASDFGYHVKFFAKGELPELNKVIDERAKERAEVQSKLGSPREQLEKLLAAHRM